VIIPEVFMKKEVVLSPCVGVCALDDNDVCIGCFRSGNEIREWSGYSNENKREVLVNCDKRTTEAKAWL